MTLTAAVVVVALVSGAVRPAAAAEAADHGELRIFVTLRSEPFDVPIIEVRRDEGDGRFDPAVDDLVADPTHPVEGAVRLEGVAPGNLWIVETAVPDGVDGIEPMLVELNVTPLTRCFWGGEEPTSCDASEDDPPITFVYIDNDRVIAGDGILVISSRTDNGTPDEPFDDDTPLEGVAFAVRQDDGDRRLDASDDQLVDGLTPYTYGRFVIDTLGAGGYWIVQTDAPPGYRPATPMFVELNTEPGIQCRWTVDAEPSCDEVDIDFEPFAVTEAVMVSARGAGTPAPTPPPTDMETD